MLPRTPYLYLSAAYILTSIGMSRASSGTTVPAGYSCYSVYPHGGGTVWKPLPSSQSEPKGTNKGITIVLPVVVGVVGLAAIVGVRPPSFYSWRTYLPMLPDNHLIPSDAWLSYPFP